MELLAFLVFAAVVFFITVPPSKDPVIREKERRVKKEMAPK